MSGTGETIQRVLGRKSILHFPNYPVLYVWAEHRELLVLSRGLQRMGNPPRLYPSSLLLYSRISVEFLPFPKPLWLFFMVYQCQQLTSPPWQWLLVNVGPSPPFSAQSMRGEELTAPGKNLGDLYIHQRWKTQGKAGKQPKTSSSHAGSLKRVLCWISDGSQCRPPYRSPLVRIKL